MIDVPGEFFIQHRKLKIKRLDNNLPLPKKVYPTDAGIDLYSAVNRHICKGLIEKISTGICIELPVGYYAEVVPRSGLASEYGITLVNSPAIIDNHFRGEIVLVVVGLIGCYDIKRGDRIAQLIIRKQYDFEIREVDELTATDRGNKGLGSTGV